MIGATDCLIGRAPISGFAAISRYRERELVSQFRQHIGPDEIGQFPGLSNCHVQSLPSSNAASVCCRLHPEVVPKDIPQPMKIVRPEALCLEEYRALSSIARPIVHEPNCERFRMSEQRSDRLRDDLLAAHVEQPSQFSQIRMAPCNKPPERIPAVVVTVQRGRLEFQEFLTLPGDVRLEARCVIHLEPDASAVWLEISIPQHNPDQRLLHTRLPFFPRYCPSRHSEPREGSTDISR